MNLVELIHFPASDEHESPILVNPAHVVLVVPAQRPPGSQCWMHLAWSGSSYLVKGSLADIAYTLNHGAGA